MDSNKDEFEADGEVVIGSSDEYICFNKETVCRLKRRFPGPAGLLPTISPKELKLLNQSPHPLSQQFSKIIADDSSVADKEVVALQGIMPGLEPRCEQERIYFRKAPWKEMLKQLQIDESNDMCPLKFMNIKWIRTKSPKLPSFFKIPFLLVVLKEAPEIHVGRGKARPKNPSVKLIDTTGSIIAAMDAEVIASFGEDMFPGTAIALRNVGLIRFNRQVLLTITRKNLLCITSVANDGLKSVNDSLDSRDTKNFSILDGNIPTMEITNENVKITKFFDFDVDLVMQEFKEIGNLKVNSLEEMYGCVEAETTSFKSPSLFTNIENVPNRSANYPPVRHNNVVPSPMVHVQTTSKPAMEEMDMSAFDDDDDELFQAIDNIDFGNEDIFGAKK